MFYLLQVAKDKEIKSQKISLSAKDRKAKELSSKLLEVETGRSASERQVRQLQQEIDDVKLSRQQSATDLVLARFDIEYKDRQIAMLHKKFEDIKALIASESSIYSPRIADIIGGAGPSAGAADAVSLA